MSGGGKSRDGRGEAIDEVRDEGRDSAERVLR
jgi:hypothetical protein